MLTEDQLLEREQIAIEEINDLMEEFDVSPMDLADECECTLSTFQIYLGDNKTDMPQKHQQTIIHYFLRKFGYQEMEQNGVPEATQSDKAEEEPDPEPEQPDTDFPEGASDLEHLVPDRIIFRPKNGLPEALEEAAALADVHRSKVFVRSGTRLITINVEQQ